MPTYEYKCNACGHAFEKFQSITATAIKTCPHCGADQAQRQISGGAGFIFKGGGFYETDYRSDAYKKSAEADKAPTSADAKPAADAKPGDAAKPAESTKPAESKPAAEPATPAPAPTNSEAAKSPPTPPPAGG